MALGLTWDLAPLFGAGVALVLLGLWLIVLDRRDRVHLAFAAFLLARGLGNLGNAFGLSTATDAATIAPLTPWLFGIWLVVPFAAVWFVVELRAKHGAHRRRRWTLPVLGAGAGFVVLAYVVAPARFVRFPQEPAGSAADHFLAAEYGLYGLLFGVVQLTYGLLALALASDAVAQSSAPRRRALLLVIAGLASLPAVSAIGGVLSTSMVTTTVFTPRFDAGLRFANLALFSLAVVSVAVALARIARPGPDNEVEPGEARRVVALPLAFAAVALFTVVGFALGLLGQAEAWVLANTLDGLATLALPVLATFALVRYQLFGLDAKVKLAIKGSTMAAIFLAIFFIVSESAAAFFEGRVGTYVGIAAAGLLVFALAPLQRLAQRVADTAMPGVKPVRDMDVDERARAYAEVVEVAWSDGSLSRKDRTMLATVRDKLGLSVEEAARIEERLAAS